MNDHGISSSYIILKGKTIKAQITTPLEMRIAKLK
jgi:hypothetical protein